jgi:hypothetical protein
MPRTSNRILSRTFVIGGLVDVAREGLGGLVEVRTPRAEGLADHSLGSIGRQFGHGPRAVRGAIDAVVVDHHQLIAAPLHVELHGVHAEPHRLPERGQRILGRKRRRAAVADDGERPFG